LEKYPDTALSIVRTLLIFIKNPRLGYVKTRLAATVGPDEALRIYQILLEHTRLVTERVQANRWLYYSDSVDQDDKWSSQHFDKKMQSTGDLGQRMLAAFEAAFAAGSHQVVIIGSDCAELTATHIEAAFEALNTSDVVLGPSLDGGYYLLGMNQLIPTLFEGIAWSTEQVLHQTQTAVAAIGLRCHLLEPLSDIDTEADWKYSKTHLGFV
jgi:uncharacterized protein